MNRVTRRRALRTLFGAAASFAAATALAAGAVTEVLRLTDGAPVTVFRDQREVTLGGI